MLPPVLAARSAVKLTPHVELVAVAVAGPGALVLGVLALVAVPVLAAVVQGEGVAPAVLDDACRGVAVDPQLQVAGGLDLDLVVGVGGRPGADVLPVEAITHGLGWCRVVQEVHIPLLRAGVAAEAVGGCHWSARARF